MQALVAALSLGFLSSLHCVGMCGPIALALPLNRSSKLNALGGILLYNLGRSFSYAFLGGMLGLAGMGLLLHHSRRAGPVGVDRAIASSDAWLRPRRERRGRVDEPACILWCSTKETARYGTRVTRNGILARDPSPGSPVGTGV